MLSQLKIFEALVVNFMLIFMLIPSIKKFVRSKRELKNRFGRNHHIGYPGTCEKGVFDCNMAFFAVFYWYCNATSTPTLHAKVSPPSLLINTS